MEDLFPGIIVVLFPFFWMAICVFLSALGGWNGLAKRFPDSHPRIENPLYLQAGRFRELTSYGGVLVAGFRDDGLQLRVLLPFRVGHPPLLIPWTEIRYRGETAGLFQNTHNVTLGDLNVRLFGTLGERVRDRVLGSGTIVRRRERPEGEKPPVDEFSQFRDNRLKEQAKADAPHSPPPSVEARRRQAETERCPYCHDDIHARPAEECRECATLHHTECLMEHGGCAILACRGRVRE